MSRKKRRLSTHDEEVSPDEALRRQRQRELQKLAIRVRLQGREYNPHRGRARVYKSDNVDVVPRPSQARKLECGTKVGGSARADFQVLVLPIFWNQRPDEKQRVLQCCQSAADLLQTAGFSHHVDKSSHSTPGQKMRHWEERGVKVRLEIGPKDAEQSICTIARSQPTPGAVAYKQPGDVNKSLAKQVQAMLDIPDKDVPAGDYSKYEKSNAAAAQIDERPRTSKAEGRAHDASDAAANDGAARTSVTGDALEDDFGSDLEIDDEETALTAADKRRRQKRLDKLRKQKRDAAR